MSTESVVHIVDDDPATLDAMHAQLESAGLHTRRYIKAEDFLQKMETSSAGCLVVDLRMPRMNGLELQHRVREACPDMPIIFITGYGNISAAVRAMRAGADDFLTKPVDDEILIERVQEVLARRANSELKQFERDKLRRRMDELTPREREVMEGVVAGLSSKTIARNLGISPKTVELHRAHMMEKMEAKSIADLVRYNVFVRYTASPP